MLKNILTLVIKNAIKIIFGLLILFFVLSKIESCSNNKLLERAEIWLNEQETRIGGLIIEKDELKNKINQDIILKEELRKEIEQYIIKIQNLRRIQNKPDNETVATEITEVNGNVMYNSFFEYVRRYLTLDIGFDEKVKLIIDKYEVIIVKKDEEIVYLKELTQKLAKRKKRFCLSIGPGIGITTTGHFSINLISIHFGYVIK